MYGELGEVVKVDKVRIIAAALLAASVLSAPAGAQTAAPSAMQAATAVSAFYDSYHSQLWFRGGVESPAVAQLVSVLQRAAFDGFPQGPLLATQVQAAAAQARSGNAADIAAAERVLSTAWVQYIQTIKQPTTGMVYSYPILAPQGSRPDQILLTASAAPSLEAYVSQTSSVNPLYAQIRNAAWAEAQATGNTTPDPRLLANLDRVRSLPATGKFILVDSGSQMLTMFENGSPVDSMKIVVGKTDYKTPMIASVMYYIVYNPYWNAPDHLVRKIAQNYLTMGDGYLRSRGYQVMKDWTASSEVVPASQINWKAVASGKEQIRIRQKPQDDNSMGDLKFPFPNALDIFLHDTPHKEYFAKPTRFLSNGCVRLEDAKRFGRWLLGSEPVSPGTDAEIQVQLPRGVPVYLTYITAQVRDGKVSYLPDVYGWDKQAPVFASAAH